MGVSYMFFSLIPEVRSWLEQFKVSCDHDAVSRDPTFADVLEVLKAFDGFQIECEKHDSAFWASVTYKKKDGWAISAELNWPPSDENGAFGSFRKPSLELALEMVWRLSALTGPLVFGFDGIPVLVSAKQTFFQLLDSVAVVYPWVETSKLHLPSETPRIDAENQLENLSKLDV
jgi:hypothetical protein